jgi:hypothetical protein
VALPLTMGGMDSLEAYRTLDLEPNASSDEVRRSYRDLAKVWHPDRFAGDPALRLKAEARLKIINEAYARLAKEKPRGRTREQATPKGSWMVRRGGVVMEVGSLEELKRWVASGAVAASHEVMEPSTERWREAREIEQLQDALTVYRVRKMRQYAFFAAAFGLLILFKKPSPAGAAIAFTLLTLAWSLFSISKGKIRRMKDRRNS